MYRNLPHINNETMYKTCGTECARSPVLWIRNDSVRIRSLPLMIHNGISSRPFIILKVLQGNMYAPVIKD